MEPDHVLPSVGKGRSMIRTPMSTLRRVLLGMLVAASASSCSGTPPDSVGRPCSETEPCGPGAVCDLASKVCVRAGDLYSGDLFGLPRDYLVPEHAPDGVRDAPADLLPWESGPPDLPASSENPGRDAAADKHPTSDRAAADQPRPVDLSCSCSPGTGDRCAGTQCVCGTTGGPCTGGRNCVGGKCTCIANGLCPGCCSGDNCVALASQSVSSCGKNGAACQGCFGGDACHNAQTCSSGTCTGGGNKSDGTSCSGGKCCGGSCCGGCCAGGSCRSGGDANACGSGGNGCSDCTNGGNPCKTSGSCSGGSCTGGGNVSDGTACGSGKCCGGSCSTGCCSGGSSLPGMSKNWCGIGGNACQNCEAQSLPACRDRWECPTGSCQTVSSPDGTSCSVGGQSATCHGGKCCIDGGLPSGGSSLNCCSGGQCSCTCGTLCAVSGMSCPNLCSSSC